MGNIQTVGPNEVMVVSGGCCRPSSKKIIQGGWCWSTWMLTNIQRISLQVMTVNPKCEHVQSCHGVPVTVTAIVHFKISSADASIPFAIEQFLGKTNDQIKSIVLQTVEGHMRTTIGTQTMEHICRNRKELAGLTREAATVDLADMGIDILSLTIKEIKDDVEYLSSTGKKTTAIVKRDAAISAAKAENEAAKVEASFEQDIQETSIKLEAKLSKIRHEKEMSEADQTKEIEKLRAEAEKAYDLELAHLQRDIREKEMEVKSKEFDELIEVQRLEGERRKTELEMEIDLPTKSQIYELKKQTEAMERKRKYELEAEEFKIRIEGKAQAEADAIEGHEEAKGMKLVAEARKDFNEAAVLHEVLKVLPDIAAEIASPLTKFEEIVLISDGNKIEPGASAMAAKLAGSVPTAIKAVGGSERLSSGMLSTIMSLQKSAS